MGQPVGVRGLYPTRSPSKPSRSMLFGGHAADVTPVTAPRSELEIDTYALLNEPGCRDDAVPARRRSV
ncbi:MAG: hypothetical protein ABI629_11650 [bacterium]